MARTIHIMLTQVFLQIFKKLMLSKLKFQYIFWHLMLMVCPSTPIHSGWPMFTLYDEKDTWVRRPANTFSHKHFHTFESFLSTCWLETSTFAVIFSQFPLFGDLVSNAGGRCLHYIRRRTLLSKWVWDRLSKHTETRILEVNGETLFKVHPFRPNKWAKLRLSLT